MKRLIADLTEVNKQTDGVQCVTDSMANSKPITIDYQGSGLRNVQPYGWKESQDNNLLLMCYKDDASVRSYRWDKIDKVEVDDKIANPTVNQLNDDNPSTDNNQEKSIIPTLPDNNGEEKHDNAPFANAVTKIKNTITDSTNYVEEYQQMQQNGGLFGENDLDFSNDDPYADDGFDPSAEFNEDLDADEFSDLYSDDTDDTDDTDFDNDIDDSTDDDFDFDFDDVDTDLDEE